MRKVLFLAAALSAVSCVASSALEPASVAAAGERLALTFAWPAGTTATYHRVRQKELGGAPGAPMSMTYTLSTEPLSEGRLLLRLRAPRAFSLGGANLSQEQTRQVSELAEMVPDLVFDTKGQVVALEGADRVRSVMERVLPIPDDVTGAARDALLAMRSDEGLRRIADSEWGPMASFWHGRDVVVGRKHEVQTTSVFPLGSIEVEAKVTYGATEVAPCPGREEWQCVRLFYHSEVDPASMGPVYEHVRHLVGGTEAPVKIGRFEQIQDFELLAELTTLRPFEYTRTDTTNVELSVGGVPQGSRQIKTTRDRFEWQDE